MERTYKLFAEVDLGIEPRSAALQGCNVNHKTTVPQHKARDTSGLRLHREYEDLLFIKANLVLHQTVERIHVGKKYGDIPRGIFVVRGENVVLLGEIDLEKESDTKLLQVSIEEILEEQRVEQQSKQEAERVKVQALKERGLSIPRADTLDEY
ncbi:hypothetical protein GDO81_017415 [Engystomops pustulosus]|uniref:U6 snRNA-associated Sm-like protein LSm1 n=3 Tax=Engystomops pustulosus TaxID=76066 RepID=A0AAV7AFV9_ENGPU|nr:hypothetical protein GDO81_017415 [Engystomops pustulosus]